MEVRVRAAAYIRLPRNASRDDYPRVRDLGLGSPARRVVPPSSAPGTRGVASPPGPSSDGTDRLLPRPYRTTVEDAPDGARPWSWSGGRFDRGCGRPPRVFLPRRVGRFRQPPHAASVAVPAPAAAVRTSTALETDQRRVFTLDTRWWWTHGLPPQLVNRGGRSRGASGVARTPGPTWVGHPAGAALESAPGRAVAARRFRRIGRPALRRTRAGRRSSTRCGSQSLRGEARGCAAAPRSSPGRRREQRSPPFPPGQPALVFLQLLLFR